MTSPDHEPDGQAPVNAVKPDDDFVWAIREATPEDHDFVAYSWRRSYDLNGANPLCRCPGGVDEYIRTQRSVIETCLAASRVLVAHPEYPKRRPEQIMGWVCFRSPSVLHYVYTKATFRQLGIAKDLCRQAFGGMPTRLWCSHAPWERSEAADCLFRSVRSIEFNPWLIFGGAP